MALFTVASAKGSPGVSITAVALAARWPTDCILADLDPAGGDVALRYRSATGEPLDTNQGLLSLGAAVRSGRGQVDVDSHLQMISGGLPTLVGVSSPSQVQGMGQAWIHLATSLGGLPDRDVIADCGRVTPGSATLSVLHNSDAVLLMTRPSLEGVAHLRERIRELREGLRLGGVDGVPVGIGVLTSSRDSRSVPDLQRLLDAAELPARVLGVVAEDVKAADALRVGAGNRIHRSLLMRSIAQIASGLIGLAAQRAAYRRADF